MTTNTETTAPVYGPEAFQWHHRPKSSRRRPCSICGCPVKQPGEHQKVPDGDGWVRRRKTDRGWQYLPILPHVGGHVDVAVGIESKTPADSVPPSADIAGGFKCKHISHARRNSLSRYFYETFVPEELAKCSKHTARKYETAVGKYVQFCQRDVTMGEITDGSTDKFCEWCVRNGVGFESARQYRVYVRRIARHARPEVCPKQSGRRPHEAEDDQAAPPTCELDVDGSIWRFFQEIYRPQRLVGCGHGSVSNYETEVRRLFRHIGRPPLIADLSDELLAAHQSWLLEDGYSERTVNGMTTNIRTLWNAAADLGLIVKRPTVRKLREPKRLPEAWSVDELGRILRACSILDERPGSPRSTGIPPGLWFRAYLLVLYDTGLRKRAVLSIRHADIDLETRWLKVPPESMKTAVEQRFRLSEQTIDAVRRIWTPPRARLFPIKEPTFSKRFGKILIEAGFEDTPRNKSHKIRRTTATQLAVDHGFAAAMKQLGHSSETMTSRYIDPRFLSAHDTSGDLRRPKF